MNWIIDNNLGSITDIMFHDILKAFKDKGKYTGSLDVVPLSNACMKIIKIGDAFLASLFFLIEEYVVFVFSGVSNHHFIF